MESTASSPNSHDRQDFNKTCHAAEELLFRLERSPGDNEALLQLHQQIQHLRTCLGSLGCGALSPLLQSLEDVLQALQDGRLTDDTMISDLILINLDCARSQVKALLVNGVKGRCEAHSPLLSQVLARLSHSDDARLQQQILREALVAMDPTLLPDQMFKSVVFWRDNRAADDAFNRMLAEHWNISDNHDLVFLSHLHVPIEERAPYWCGRTRRLAILSLLINHCAGQPVDPTQLLAAVYTHDIGMAFLPIELLSSEACYTAKQVKLMQRHIDTGYDLLKRMGHWDQAAEIVLQHHENYDGSGYPSGLEENSINPGAKILAISGSFDACLHGRPHRVVERRPIQRAILEINHYSDSQFDPFWVNIFNQVAESHLIN